MELRDMSFDKVRTYQQ